MQHTYKADQKRKIEIIDSKPNTTKPAVQKKAPLKSEVCAQLKALQEKYTALEEENKWNTAIINQLELKVSQFEENESLKIYKHPESDSVPVQTDEIILCHKSDYQAEDNIDLDGHTYSEHAVENYLTCCYCQNAFDYKKELMIHWEKYHIERVNTCRDFSEGVCPFTDRVCW